MGFLHTSLQKSSKTAATSLHFQQGSIHQMPPVVCSRTSRQHKISILLSRSSNVLFWTRCESYVSDHRRSLGCTKTCLCSWAELIRRRYFRTPSMARCSATPWLHPPDYKSAEALHLFQRARLSRALNQYIRSLARQRSHSQHAALHRGHQSHAAAAEPGTICPYGRTETKSA